MDRMNTDDSFYKFERRPDLSEEGRTFEFRSRDAEGGGGGGGSAAKAKSPVDEDASEDRTPFAISANVTGADFAGKANAISIRVLGGKYSTFGGTVFTVGGGDFPAVVFSSTEVAGGTARPNVVLRIPVEPSTAGTSGAVKCSDGSYAKAKTGGVVGLVKTPSAAFPFRLFTPALGQFFEVSLGEWAVRFVPIPGGGVTTSQNRVFVNQKVSQDVVLGDPDNSTADSGVSSLPFQVQLAGPNKGTIEGGKLHKSDLTTNVTVTGLGSVVTLVDSQKWWLEVTVSSLDPTTSEIKQGSTFPDKFITTGSGSALAQTKFNVPIGYVISGSSTLPGFDFKIGTNNYHFEQLLGSHLLVQLMSVLGYTRVFALPWSGT